MGRPARRDLINEAVPGIYHVYSRTVRRSFLLGEDSVTGKDYSHRQGTLLRAIQALARIFAIDVLAFGFLQNHYHEILRNRPDLVEKMSDYQIAARTVLLSDMGLLLDTDPPERSAKDRARLRRKFAALIADPERIRKARRSLSSISVYQQRLKATIARLANREDGVTGSFWSGRFGSKALKTPTELLVAMIYVDLNPVRAGLAETPEDSRYTSAYERIQGLRARMQDEGEVPDDFYDAEQMQKMTPLAADPAIRKLLDNWISPIDERREGVPSQNLDWLEPVIDENCPLWRAGSAGAIDEEPTPEGADLEVANLPARASNKGCLSMSLWEYLRLLDWSGRQWRSDKSGQIPEHLPPILERLGLGSPETWLATLQDFAETLARRFTAPINQATEAARAVVRTATGPQTCPAALM